VILYILRIVSIARRHNVQKVLNFVTHLRMRRSDLLMQAAWNLVRYLLKRLKVFGLGLMEVRLGTLWVELNV
jgi:hypothetical protein